MSVHKIPTASDQEQKKLQQLSFIANTQFNLSSQFLNTLLGRSDINIEDEATKEALVDLSFEYAQALMLKLNMIVKTPVE